jgi:7,8-dihydropterin-6-yl-methyl-4-(beta-D-ribofuranosyl)aminobenzene 5'-phosphate synthase
VEYEDGQTGTAGRNASDAVMKEATVKLGETTDVSVTLVVDNYADIFAGSKAGVERYGLRGEPLLAEHGFSVLVRLHAEEHEVLLDTGYSKVALLHNLSRLGIELEGVDEVVISHGHPDHTGSVVEFLRSRAERTPVVAHPHAFVERWRVLADGSREGVCQTSAEPWEQAGADIVYVEGPRQLANGCLVTGSVPRRTEFEKVTGRAFRTEEGAVAPDELPDDQAMVLNVRGKGLVVITGCAHAGVVNTVLYAQEISGVRAVHAVIGGFHLGGASAERLARTMAELTAVSPRLIVPAHCTGFEATCRFAAEMPEQFVLGGVGTTLKF